MIVYVENPKASKKWSTRPNYWVYFDNKFYLPFLGENECFYFFVMQLIYVLWENGFYFYFFFILKNRK